MGNSVEHISQTIIVYFSVTLRDAQRAGALLPQFFQKGSNGAGGNFSSQYHREFHGKVLLKQSNCSYSCTYNIQNGFLHSLLVFMRSTLLLNRNKHIGEEFFVF